MSYCSLCGEGLIYSRLMHHSSLQLASSSHCDHRDRLKCMTAGSSLLTLYHFVFFCDSLSELRLNDSNAQQPDLQAFDVSFLLSNQSYFTLYMHYVFAASVVKLVCIGHTSWLCQYIYLVQFAIELSVTTHFLSLLAFSMLGLLDPFLMSRSLIHTVVERYLNNLSVFSTSDPSGSDIVRPTPL